MAATVRIESSAHEALSAIARAKHLSLTEAPSLAIEAYRREVFVSDLAVDFAAQKDDASGWAEELAERAAWDGTVADGLPLDPPLASGRRRPAAALRSKKKLPTKTVGGKQRPR